MTRTNVMRATVEAACDMAPAYPKLHMRRASRQRRHLFIAAPLILGLQAFALHRAIFGSGSVLLAAVETIIGAYILFILLISIAEKCTGVFPFFCKPVNGRSIGVSQPAITRNFERLNRTATSIGVRPLDSFGVIEHCCNFVSKWHDPADAVATVGALIEAVRENPQEMDSPDQLIQELAALLARLTQAQEQQIPFTFCLRHGSGGSMMEPVALMG